MENFACFKSLWSVDKGPEQPKGSIILPLSEHYRLKGDDGDAQELISLTLLNLER